VVVICGVNLSNVTNCTLGDMPVASATQLGNNHWALVSAAADFTGTAAIGCMTSRGPAMNPAVTFTYF
jgi:hypothetical protein